MNQNVFSSLSFHAQESLTRLSTALEGMRPAADFSWEIDVSTLPSEADTLRLLNDVRDWAGKSKLCLYYFECTDEYVDLAAVQHAFANAKAHESNNRAYARLNVPNRCFYVGSSQSIAKRLSEHLGYGASATYALQLVHWARPLSLKLRFVCAKYNDGVPYEIVQALEDSLWELKNPMFGRQGRK